MILLVEDNDDVRNVHKELLEMSGFNVITANDCLDAFNRFEENYHKVRCVVSDIDLGDQLDGISLHNIIKRKHPSWHGNFIAFSGGCSENNKRYLKEWKVPFFTKGSGHLDLVAYLNRISFAA